MSSQALYIQYGNDGMTLSALCVSVWHRNAVMLWLEYSSSQLAVVMGIWILLALTWGNVCHVLSQPDFGKEKLSEEHCVSR